jgi:NDP-sugar pyrophosphorylase family protein
MNGANLMVLAAGASSRMKQSSGSLSDPLLAEQAATLPKAMISVGRSGRPLLDYLLYNALQAGYREILLVVGENDATIRSRYARLAPSHPLRALSFAYAVQHVPRGRSKPLGTADAVMQALHAMPSWKGERFTVCNSDNLYSRRALEALRSSEADCAMIDYDRDGLRFERARIEKFAVLIKDGRGSLTEIVEKPTPEQFDAAKDPSGRVGVSMNIWRFRYDLVLPFLERMPLHPERKEKELPVAVMTMIREGVRVQAIPLSEEVPDLTSGGDIAAFGEYLDREYPDLP